MYRFPVYFSSMKAMEYIESHPVFTTADVRAVSPSGETAETVLRRAVASGRAERIRRGLYASRAGAFAARSPEPADVLAAADPGAVLSYRSALAAHGLSHSVPFDLAFRSGRVRSAFEFDGVRYTPYPADPAVRFQLKRLGTGVPSKVTTREQTFVDCLERPGRAGGGEEVIRALSGIAYLDLGELSEMLASRPASVRARAGWLLEANRGKWGVDDALLEGLARGLGGGAARFGSKGDPVLSWSSRWGLALPYSGEELEEWTR